MKNPVNIKKMGGEKLVQSICSGAGEVLKLMGGQGLDLSKVTGFAKSKGIDGSFTDKLGSILKKYDQNGDNCLNPTEAKKALQDLKGKLGIGNGGINLDGLKAFKETAEKEGITKTPILDTLISNFAAFDTNNNGKLSAGELKSALNTYKTVMQS
ncbi:MAG: hypothetical protein WCK67_13140 [bacterium]